MMTDEYTAFSVVNCFQICIFVSSNTTLAEVPATGHAL